MCIRTRLLASQRVFNREPHIVCCKRKRHPQDEDDLLEDELMLEDVEEEGEEEGEEGVCDAASEFEPGG